MLFIHEISHAVAGVGHGKKWQGRMENAAKRADELGRHRLAQLLREEIIGYQEASTSEELEAAYNTIRDALIDRPDLTFLQIKRSLADQYGLLLSEVCTAFRRAEKVYRQARQEAQEARAIKQAWLRRRSQAVGAVTGPLTSQGSGE